MVGAVGLNEACAVQSVSSCNNRENISLAIEYHLVSWRTIWSKQPPTRARKHHHSRGHGCSEYAAWHPGPGSRTEGNHVGIHGRFSDKAGHPTALSTEPSTTTAPNYTASGRTESSTSSNVMAVGKYTNASSRNAWNEHGITPGTI